MRRAVPLELFLLCAVVVVFFRQSTAPCALVKIKIRAALFDHDLSLKPVPRLLINHQAPNTCRPKSSFSRSA